MKIGDLVMLIGTDGFMPPLGAIGEIVGWDGEDFEVEFPRHPCPALPGTYWCALPSWLVLIRGGNSHVLDSVREIA